MTEFSESEGVAAFKRMAREAIEDTTEMIADMAEKFAKTCPADMDGETALTAFAEAIRETNRKRSATSAH